MKRIMCVCGTAEGWYVALTGGVTVAGVLKAYAYGFKQAPAQS